MEEDASIVLGPLRIWVSGYEYPDAPDYWDANWLLATARCVGNGSHVEVRGAFIHLSEIKKWKEDLEPFSQTLKGVVELPAMEPTLAIKIEAQKPSTGHLSCEVGLADEHIPEYHRYKFEIDQSHITSLLAQLAAIMKQFPIRNERAG